MARTHEQPNSSPPPLTINACLPEHSEKARAIVAYPACCFFPPATRKMNTAFAFGASICRAFAADALLISLTVKVPFVIGLQTARASYFPSPDIVWVARKARARFVRVDSPKPGTKRIGNRIPI